MLLKEKDRNNGVSVEKLVFLEEAFSQRRKALEDHIWWNENWILEEISNIKFLVYPIALDIREVSRLPLFILFHL